MPQRKAASKAKAQISEQQDDGRQDITITAPATIARDGLIADQPSQREDKLSPLKRRHEAQAKDLDSATKSEDATKWYLEIEERVNKAMKATREEPVPDPRATPTRAPPEDHYLSGIQWARIDRKTFTRGFDSLDGAMYQWTYNFANDEPDEIETRMTAEDKQAIIDFLGDWCLYDDWDSLVASFSPLAYLGRFQILLTATVLKNVFESVVRNPFFYIDLGMDWDGSGSDLPTEYGEELNNVFQKALRGMSPGL
ncbi:hypothetical protein F1880_000650 [Penicillium rolfsii]|nr:hypothetical protein F1880_000650 [Penicillium rolfsii]